MKSTGHYFCLSPTQKCYSGNRDTERTTSHCTALSQQSNDPRKKSSLTFDNKDVTLVRHGHNQGFKSLWLLDFWKKECIWVTDCKTAVTTTSLRHKLWGSVYWSDINGKQWVIPHVEISVFLSKKHASYTMLRFEIWHSRDILTHCFQCLYVPSWTINTTC